MTLAGGVHHCTSCPRYTFTVNTMTSTLEPSNSTAYPEVPREHTDPTPCTLCKTFSQHKQSRLNIGSNYSTSSLQNTMHNSSINHLTSCLAPSPFRSPSSHHSPKISHLIFPRLKTHPHPTQTPHPPSPPPQPSHSPSLPPHPLESSAQAVRSHSSPD